MENQENGKERSWGGARAGAGRKKNFAGARYYFGSTPEVQAILDSLDGNKSAFINEAIMYYVSHHGM